MPLVKRQVCLYFCRHSVLVDALQFIWSLVCFSSSLLIAVLWFLPRTSGCAQVGLEACHALSLLIWDLKVWGPSLSWEAKLTVEMDSPTKQIIHTLCFLLYFSHAKSCEVDWGLTTPLTFVPAAKQSLDKFFGGHVCVDSIANWKGKNLLLEA